MSEKGGNGAKNKKQRKHSVPNKGTPNTDEPKPDEVQTPVKELTAREAYFACLEQWVKNANISQNAMALFPWYLMNNYPQVFQNQQAGFGMPTTETNQPNVNPSANINTPNNAQPTPPPAAAAAPVVNNRRMRFLDDQAQADLVFRHGGFEYVIAPFWKRVVAESIDFLLLLIVKIILSFTVLNIFDMDIGFDVDKTMLSKSMEDDNMGEFVKKLIEAFFSSSDLLLFEIVTKAIVCYYEAVCTTFCNGATPGKALMGLRVHYAEAVVVINPPLVPQMPLQLQMQRTPTKALIYPATVPTFKRALTRAALKNIIITMLFPVCIFMVFFKNNRTVYDMVSKTVVVETTANPPQRNQP
ncbi:protein FAM8A1-like [Teleopsis dalmanni]|uniref:protein FAM8A1-like n=1 Tax=Teleopsis dalmanni TaxID=139649 RepID=UPI0018CE6C97|nr:protein FAM8A1-like [Teleopsis dalmanni]